MRNTGIPQPSVLVIYCLFQASKVIDARRGLRIHHIGEQDELIDTLGHFRESYQLAPGQCVLIRPDGYVGAFFHGKQSNDIENYLSRFAIGIKDEY